MDDHLQVMVRSMTSLVSRTQTTQPAGAHQLASTAASS